MSTSRWGTVDEVLQELRAFRERLPEWAGALARQRGYGTGGDGSVRACCAVSGDVTQVEVEDRFLRESRPDQVDAAILAALRNAQAAANELLVSQQESLQFLGAPVGEALSGKRSFEDLLGISGRVPPNPGGRGET